MYYQIITSVDLFLRPMHCAPCIKTQINFYKLLYWGTNLHRQHPALNCLLLSLHIIHKKEQILLNDEYF